MMMEMAMEPEEVGGMFDDEYNAKHIRLRGSLDLKYPPRESACRNECRAGDYFKHTNKAPENHRCFLATGHKGPCEFSSECVGTV